jgi:hypothetical protein
VDHETAGGGEVRSKARERRHSSLGRLDVRVARGRKDHGIVLAVEIDGFDRAVRNRRGDAMSNQMRAAGLDELVRSFHPGWMMPEAGESDQIAPGAATDEEHARRRRDPSRVDADLERIETSIDLIGSSAEPVILDPHRGPEITAEQRACRQVIARAAGTMQQLAGAPQQSIPSRSKRPGGPERANDVGHHDILTARSR